MSFSKFDWASWLMGAGAAGVMFFVGEGLCLPLVGSLSDGVFCFDVLSFYFMGLSLVLGLSLIFWQSCFSGPSRFMISLSLCCSLLSYCCVHSLGFWVFYEGAMLPLLFLLIRESPYSERYVASWYLLGYVVLTSLPMLLCLFYLSVEVGSFSLCHWGGASSLGGFSAILLLSVLFMTKIPLPPFHVWLPIVHAEASSPVSVCLSGYMMKLGLLGVYRFCSWLLPSYIFSVFYVGVCVAMAFLFFFSASRELDGKRWLAFMSLSHILIPALCLCVSGFDSLGVSFLYCLGHGASAGATFLFLWLVYEVSGSRNWAVLKFGLSSSLLMRFLAGACLCTVASLPPTVQFFCEVHTLWEAGAVAACFVFGVFCYLFCGGLVPIFVLGGLLTRHYSVSFGSGSIFMGLCSVFFLLMWSFVLFSVG